MSYAQRMTIAGVCSVLLHGLLLTAGGGRYAGFGPSTPVAPEPIVLNLQPRTPEPRQLVDVQTPADEPVEPTDLIAEMSSKASDQQLSQGERPGPKFDHVDEFDTLAAPPAPPVPKPSAQPVPKTAKAVDNEKKTARASDKKVSAPIKAEPAETPQESQTPEPERFDVARAMPPAAPALPKGVSKGRLLNEVKREGFTNFEAIQDEIAPYLREIRNRVEKRWIEGLVTRYSGTQPTKAVIDCQISPDGRLVSAEIVGVPEDPLYAALCQRALQRAAPFGPFPFQVPDVYRNQNLEIRWTFSFL
jgi:hypothetical protein